MCNYSVIARSFVHQSLQKFGKKSYHFKQEILKLKKQQKNTKFVHQSLQNFGKKSYYFTQEILKLKKKKKTPNLISHFGGNIFVRTS